MLSKVSFSQKVSVNISEVRVDFFVQLEFPKSSDDWLYHFGHLYLVKSWIIQEKNRFEFPKDSCSTLDIYFKDVTSQVLFLSSFETTIEEVFLVLCEFFCGIIEARMAKKEAKVCF